MSRLRIVAVALICLSASQGQLPPATTDAPGSKIWVGRYQEFEEYLRTAECVSMERFSTFSTVRCTLRPGGPAARMAWRSLPPTAHRGFRESYKTEIAAYKLDKLLKLDMVPPSVERQLQGTAGAAQLWVENVVDGKGKESPAESRRAAWDAQVVRMTMFDNLIGNRERNRENMLRDANWNLILIDHSRAFGTDTELVHKMTRIDEDCWARMDGLTRGQLDAALRAWLDESEIRAILDRRDRMKAEIKLLAKE
jgi:hypothetical protein